MNAELVTILKKFAESGWDLIDAVSREYLDTQSNKAQLIEAITEADKQCGSCGCEFDPLYKKALALLA